MNAARRVVLALVIEAALAGFLRTDAAAQTTPVGPQWWPSRWGPADEAGASNWMTPDKVLSAARLIRTGQVYRLGRVYEAGMPLFGQRTWKLSIPSAPAGTPYGKHNVFHEDLLTTEIGQVGTQFDGLAHIGVRVAPGDLDMIRFYNGFTEADLISPNGMRKLGVEKVKPFFTRGVLLDIAGYKGVARLEKGYEISMADVRGAIAAAGLSDIGPGDAVVFNTGWGTLWMKDNALYNSGEPGIGLEVAAWLIEKMVSYVGSDSWALEVYPNPNPDLVYPVHPELITKHGIFIHENLDFTALLRDRVYEFAYIFVPVPIRGATGSPGSPIAVR